MKIMFLFCMARVAVAVAGLAVMAYVALGCTWAAIEETAPIARSDDGACLRVNWPLIEPGPCSEVGIQKVRTEKFSSTEADRWVVTNIVIPESSEWWWVAPAGAGYTVIRTADLRNIEDPPANSDTSPDASGVMYIAGHNKWVALSRDDDYNLRIWVETENQEDSLAIYRFVTAPTA